MMNNHNSRAVALLLCLLALTSLLLGQSAGERNKALTLDRGRFQQERRLALVVGVSEYPRYSGLSRLSYADDDANAVCKELERAGYTTLCLTNQEATRAAVMNAFRNLADIVEPNQGTMVFYFSGHGFAQGTANYLATFDAGANDIARSGLSLAEVQQAMVKTGARQRMLFVDACRNNPQAKSGTTPTFTQFAVAEGTRILFSTKFGRVSWERDELKQGVYTHFLLEGLRGGAARTAGIISFRDLADYVGQKVSAYTLRAGDVQVPFEAGEASGDFLVAGVPPGFVRPDDRLSTAAVVPSPVSVPEHRAGDLMEPLDLGKGVEMEFVYVPAGTFWMGCSAGDNACDGDESPRNPVTITKSFEIGKFEVTQEQWESVMGNNPSSFNGPQRPVERVSWMDVQEFLRKLNAKSDGYRYRLPNEAEWEYAARAGWSGQYYSELGRIGWYSDNSGRQTHAVGEKQPNKWELYDALGNVAEWCEDWYGGGHYREDTDEAPTGPSLGESRVVRGGSWGGSEWGLRLSGRAGHRPVDRVDFIGFRCVRQGQE
jgi:formylglycine-generating enzyme required for sulfatase activity